MPPYENQSLHDMHALLQQFDTLKAGHAPEHLEVKIFGKEVTLPSLPSNPFTSKVTDQDVIWKDLHPPERLIVFKNAFNAIAADIEATKETNGAWTVKEYDDFKKLLESHAKTKSLLQANITLNPQLKP
jgi:hypothetical protein